MTFLEAELDSEDLESYSRISSLEEIATLSFIGTEKAEFNERKWEGAHTRVAAFPILGFDLAFPFSHSNQIRI